MKTVLPSRREPHLGGLRTLKNGIFSMIFSDVFLEPVLGAILHDCGFHLGMYFGAVWIKNDIIFEKTFLSTLL